MKLYCSKCGIELTHSRKAIPGKAHILDLVDPHNCKGYAVEEVEDEKETILQVLQNLKDVETTIERVSEIQRRFPEPGDRRDNATSTAPVGLLKSLDKLTPSPHYELD